MLGLVADAGCPVVLMHSRGNSRTMDQLTDYNDVVQRCAEALLERSEAAIQAGVDGAKSSGIPVSASPRPMSRTCIC